MPYRIGQLMDALGGYVYVRMRAFVYDEVISDTLIKKALVYFWCKPSPSNIENWYEL